LANCAALTTRLRASRAVTAPPSLGRRQRGRQYQLGAFHLAEHELGNSHARFDPKRLLAVIDEHNPNLAAEVRVDGARTVHDRDAPLQRQSRTRTDLTFIPLGD